MQNYMGEIAALAVAVFWTVTALSFETASRRIGSLSLNVIRLVIGFIFLTFFVWIRRGIAFPTDATGFQWFWLSISGFVGFVFGDLFLFKSYTLISSRFSMLVMTLAPPIAALGGWIALGETMSWMAILGMFITIGGISIAIFNKPGTDEGNRSEKVQRRVSVKVSFKGLFFAFLGAIGQGVGLVLSKYGMQELDPFAATQIRLIAGFVGFAILTTYLRRWKSILLAFNDLKGIGATTLGSFFGPFLGVSFSLLAVKYTSTGIAATIMAIVPIMIIPPAILINKEKVTAMEIIGSVISIGGVALLFLT